MKCHPLAWCLCFGVITAVVIGLTFHKNPQNHAPNYKYLKPEIAHACNMYNAKDFLRLSTTHCEKQLGWIDEAFAECCINVDTGVIRDKCDDLCFRQRFKAALEFQGQDIQTKVPIFWRGSRAKYTALASSGEAASRSKYIALEGTIWGAILDSVQNDPEFQTKYGSWLKNHTQWPDGGNKNPHKVDGTGKVWDALSASLAVLTKPSSMDHPIIFTESTTSIAEHKKYKWYGTGVRQEMEKVIESGSDEYIAVDVYGQRECVADQELRIKNAVDEGKPPDAFGGDVQVCIEPWTSGVWTCEQELKKWEDLWANSPSLRVTSIGNILYSPDGKVLKITNTMQKHKYFTCVRGGDGLTVAAIDSIFADRSNPAKNTLPNYPMGKSVINQPVTTPPKKYLELVRMRFRKVTESLPGRE